jgi:hypothetical protein
VYLEVDGVDPLLSSGYTGTIPTTPAEIANVTLTNVANGSYPIWSLLRLVTVGTTVNPNVTNLANAAQQFVPQGTSGRPDFIPAPSLTVVRSHFLPPYPTPADGPTGTVANGHVGSITNSACTAPEFGGDVGGKVFTLAADSAFCTDNGVTTGHTGLRQ